MLRRRGLPDMPGRTRGGPQHGQRSRQGRRSGNDAHRWRGGRADLAHDSPLECSWNGGAGDRGSLARQPVPGDRAHP
ncbi:hypothetical protein D7X99_28605, partial [Corallococcus sp. AB032C]